MQPQLVTFLTTIEGTSMAREGVWDNRFRYVNELKRMGADIPELRANLRLLTVLIHLSVHTLRQQTFVQVRQ